MRILGVSLAVAMAWAALGCGGRSLHRIDDSLLGDLTVEQRRDALEAERARALVLEDQHRNEADLKAVEHEVEVAQAERVQREADVEVAKANLAAAKARKDDRAERQAHRQIDLAKAALKTSEAKCRFMDEQREWSAEMVDLAKVRHHRADARFELEKARLAARAGRLPGGKTLLMFEEQDNAAEKEMLEAREAVADRQEDARDAERNFHKREADLHQLTAEQIGEE